MTNILYITWDPSLGIDLGFFTIRYYSLMWGVAFLLGFQILKYIFKKDRVDLKLLDPLLSYMMLGTMLGARLGHVIFYDWSYYKNHLLEILLPFRFSPFEFTGFQGLASHGATIGIFVAMWIFSKKILKKPLLWLLDRVCIPIAIGGASVRIGNFINSEIVGSPSDLSWAVLFKQMNSSYGEMVPRHPSQLYEAFGYVVIFILLSIIYNKTSLKNRRGFIFGLFFILLWSVRFFVEFFKESQVVERSSWALNTGQLLSIPFIIIGVIILVKSMKSNYEIDDDIDNMIA